MTESKAREPVYWSVSELRHDFCPHGYLLSGPEKLKTGQHIVLKSTYDQLQSELKAKDELLRECEKALEHYANKRISEGGTARAYFEKWKKDAKT